MDALAHELKLRLSRAGSCGAAWQMLSKSECLDDSETHWVNRVIRFHALSLLFAAGALTSKPFRHDGGAIFRVRMPE